MRSQRVSRRGLPGWLAVILLASVPPALAQPPDSEPAPEPSPSPSPSPSAYRHTESVVVQAIRADAEVPITKKDIDRGEIQRLDQGQDMPALLQQAPSMTHYSDSGLGVGYSYFYIRGIQQTRVNMTLDGAPLNEPEDSAVYFADFGGFAGALSSIQIQRGVGASTVGTASFGGSINFESVDPGDEAALAAQLGLGSFASRRGSLDLHSGRLAGGLALYGRAAYQQADGFREHSGLRQRAFYFGATRAGERSSFRLSGFSGDERSQLAFLASERDVLERNPRDNPLDPAERDRFGQDFAQAQYTRFVGPSSSLAVQGYYNGAGGWYRLWEDPLARATLLQYGLDWRLVGGLLSFDHARDRLSLTWGVHANDFDSRHEQDVHGGPHVYDNRGFKSEANTFAKLGYRLGRWHLYGDAQLRHARFRYAGDVALGSVGWTFFNPKLGVRFRPAPRLALYASLGRALREPGRMDMLSGEDNATVVHDLRAVRPEHLVDYEVGAEFGGEKVSAQLVAYAMELRDEIALTGELSEIGLPLRRNVDRSHRRGLELDLEARLASSLTVRASANWNHSRIREWRQFYDVYGADGAYLETLSRTHTDVPTLLTPALTANLGLAWSVSDASLALAGRYVSPAHLDNTGNPGFRTPSFAVLDASASVELGRWLPAGRPRLRVNVSNLLDEGEIRPSGYSYLFFVRDAQGRDALSGVPYYYPLASRGVWVGLDLRL
jgi:iron complex outermembrane receptor protein